MIPGIPSFVLKVADTDAEGTTDSPLPVHLSDSMKKRTKKTKKKDESIHVYAVFIQVSPSEGVMNKSKLHLH